MLPYRNRKPQQRPEPTFYQQPRLQDIQNVSTDSVKEAKLKELLYNMSRCDVFCDDREESSEIPLWSMFHSKVQADYQQAVSNVAFNPIIMAPPTDYSTVYTTLKRMKECINSLGQAYVPVYFDMGLLTKALEITWAKPVDMQGIIPCKGVCRHWALVLRCRTQETAV